MNCVGEHWIDEFYSNVDAMRLDEVVDCFAPHGAIVFGNQPPAIGHAAIRQVLSDFWSSIESMRHEGRNRWSVGRQTTILEARVRYTTRTTQLFTVPSVTIIDRNSSGLISSLRIHIDISELLASTMADAAKV